MDFIIQNWAELLLAVLGIAKIVANLTPTTADDVVVFGWLDAAVNAIVTNNKSNEEKNDKIERRG
jgi:hypothetical protein